jgi:hypothetical protein
MLTDISIFSPRRPVSVLPALFLVFVQGCASYGRRSVDLQVIDAENGTAVPGAIVSIQPDRTYYNAPPPYDARADARGQAHFQSFARHCTWLVDAPGYMHGEYQSGILNGAINTPDYVHNTAIGPDAYVIYLYRLPAPVISIIVPNGYQGPLEIRRKLVSQLVQGSPGQRQFDFTAASNGEVSIDVTPLLYRVFSGDIQVRYQDGSTIARQHYLSRNMDIVVRDVESREDDGVRSDLMVIGTALDREWPLQRTRRR